MKLTKIDYNSAVFFGAFALIMYLIMGGIQWGLKDVLMTQGIQITALQTFIVAPVLGASIGYLITLAIIGAYNIVARKFPISWEVKK
jgi:hypothetical protein